jgi:ankyrin repeat protein
MKHPPHALFRGYVGSVTGRCLVNCISSSLTRINLQVEVNFPDSTGKTPMHVAAGIGYDWGVKALLDANADPSIKDKMNRSVVEYAEQKGQRSCVQAIHDAVTSLQIQSDEVERPSALPLEKALKQATDEDDAQQLSQNGKLSCVQAITSIHEAVTSLQTKSDEAPQTAASPLEEALNKAIDEDDAQQLYEASQQHAKRGRIDLIIDKLYDGFKGHTCLHRYRRNK